VSARPHAKQSTTYFYVNETISMSEHRAPTY